VSEALGQSYCTKTAFQQLQINDNNTIQDTRTEDDTYRRDRICRDRRTSTTTWSRRTGTAGPPNTPRRPTDLWRSTGTVDRTARRRPAVPFAPAACRRWFARPVPVFGSGRVRQPRDACPRRSSTTPPPERSTPPTRSTFVSLP